MHRILRGILFRTNSFARRITISLAASHKIQRYVDTTPNGERKLIVGGHWSDHEGWLILDQCEQDITKKLRLPTESFDAIFSEHVLEHLCFEDAVHFLREAGRVLRKGGILRTVAPFADIVTKTSFDQKRKKDDTYVKNTLITMTYSKENQLLQSLGLRGVWEDPETFFLNSVFGRHGHRFVWSTSLLTSVMQVLGYKHVRVYPPGKGRVEEYCIERRARGLYMGNDWEEDKKADQIYDVESWVVEGVA